LYLCTWDKFFPLGTVLFAMYAAKFLKDVLHQNVKYFVACLQFVTHLHCGRFLGPFWGTHYLLGKATMQVGSFTGSSPVNEVSSLSDWR
jgi:hypothetical protein